MILMGPFKLSFFYDSIILRTVKLHSDYQATEFFALLLLKIMQFMASNFSLSSSIAVRHVGLFVGSEELAIL